MATFAPKKTSADRALVSLGMTWLALTAALSVGCGAEFEPGSTIESLRVMAVQKDLPYAQPGETVELSMLWHDASLDAPRPVERLWFGGCVNPPADLYQGCFQQLAANFAALDAPGPVPGLDPGLIGNGDIFRVTLPDDIISSRPPPADPDVPHFGTAFAFFTLCAGRLGLAPEDQLDTFPLACYDENDEQLGVDDFVLGFTQIFAYDNIRNANPIITGFLVDGVEVTPDCIGNDCVGNMAGPTGDCTTEGVVCVEACEDDGDSSCPAVEIQAIIDEASAEQDQVALESEGRSVTEGMWVNYYYTDGGVKSPARLLNDATKGWNPEHGTEFYAPSTPGDVKVWAVAHDNRGGQEWVRMNIRVVARQ